LWLSDDPAARFDDETSFALPYRIVCRAGGLLLAVDLWSDRELPPDEMLRMGLRPLLTRWRAELRDIEDAEVNTGHAKQLDLWFRIARRTVNDATKLGEEVLNSGT
jgi:hypothetical protein